MARPLLIAPPENATIEELKISSKIFENEIENLLNPDF
jgi:hypothetical protein